MGYIGCGPPIKGENDEDIQMEELLYNITGGMGDLDDPESEGYGLNLSMGLPVETKSIEAAKEQYGVEGILRGFVCSACLFSECLGAPMITSIVDKGQLCHIWYKLYLYSNLSVLSFKRTLK